LSSLLWSCAFAAGVHVASAGLRGALLVGPVVAALSALLAPCPSPLAPRRPPGWRLLLLLAPALLGAAAQGLAGAGDEAPRLLSAWERSGFRAGATPVELRVRLIESAPLADGRAVLVARIVRYRVPGRPPLVGSPRRPTLARLSVPLPRGRAEVPWRPGDRLDLTARLGAPRNFGNPGSFDYAAHLRARGIGLVGTVKTVLLVRTAGRTRPGVADRLARLREALVRRLRRAAGPDERPVAAFLAAILLGERDDLPPDLEAALQRSGVYHIIALSGLNVGLILLIASAALRLAPLPPRLRPPVAALIVVLYGALARGSGSIHRATLMALLHLAGSACRRRVPASGSAAVSAVLLLAHDPAWIGDAGFQLSFAATLAILVISARPPVHRPLTWPAGALSAARAALRVSGAAQAGTFLATARLFQTLTPCALVANLIAVPLASLLLVLALAVVAVDPIVPAAGRLLCRLAGISIDLLGESAAILSAPGWMSFHVVPPPAALVLWGAVALLAAASAKRPAVRIAARAALLSSLVWVCLDGRFPSPDGTLQVTVMDVGQGDAILVTLPGGTTMLVDSGGFTRSDFDVGGRVVAPAVRALGFLKIDVLAITHAHGDHLGGALTVLDAFAPRAVWLGRMPPGDPAVEALARRAAERGIPVLTPRRGVTLSVGGARLEVLNPGPGVRAAGGAANDDSLVLRIAYGLRSALLTGDLEEPLESILVAEGRDLSADLLKAGHHGSRTSTSAAFLARIRPTLAAVSVGATNPWGHPDREVIERLEGCGASVYRTDRDGALRFVTDGLRPWRVEPLAPPGFTGRAGIRRSRSVAG
jgi:competence protein ComEC